jgi:predicted RNase H-like nuclease
MLFIGFDSAWSENNSGAIVGVLRKDDGSYLHLGDPQKANFDKATTIIEEWKEKYKPVTTLIFIDQPIIVKNEAGQRPVENILLAHLSVSAMAVCSLPTEAGLKCLVTTRRFGAS